MDFSFIIIIITINSASVQCSTYLYGNPTSLQCSTTLFAHFKHFLFANIFGQFLFFKSFFFADLFRKKFFAKVCFSAQKFLKVLQWTFPNKYLQRSFCKALQTFFLKSKYYFFCKVKQNKISMFYKTKFAKLCKDLLTYSKKIRALKKYEVL